MMWLLVLGVVAVQITTQNTYFCPSSLMISDNSYVEGTDFLLLGLGSVGKIFIATV